MFLKLKYEDVTSTGVRGEVDGKKVNFFMRVEVDELNIQEALTKFKGNKWVVSLEYTGEPSFLRTLDLGSALVIVTKQVEAIDMNVDFIMNEIDPRVRLVLELPESYSDMKAIFEYSQKYPNIRFDGGSFIRLEGCHIGALGKEDVPKKISDSRIPLTTQGYASVLPTVLIDEADLIEFYDAKTSSVEKKGRKQSDKSKSKSSKPKKQLSSLLSLSGTGGFGNF